LGSISDGELYVYGRSKDVIITFGRKLYREDRERIAESFFEVRRGRSVAVGVPDENPGTDSIVLLCELHQQMAADQQVELTSQIRARAFEKLDIFIAKLEFVAKGWVIKTTSR
jgi:acyl-CoA synthetase (AMP-forming)/AMP-acid ligase II